MRKYLYIGIGGFLGAIFRFAVRNVQLADHKVNIPLNTLFVNISGCFFLAFLLAAAFSFLELDADIRLGLATGLFGAYTTFSTLCKETAQLLENGMYLTSFAYISLTVLLGFFAAYAGFVTARALEGFLARRHTANFETKDDADEEVG